MIAETFPTAVLVAIIGLIIGLVVLFTSNFEEPPKYHSLFGYLGFVVSVCWIYGLANEVVDLLQAISTMFNLSDAILGLTVLAWGNSLGDFVSNLSMARQGFPRMAISACFGGPLLNLLLGIGLPYTILMTEKKVAIDLEYTRMISLLYGTVTLGLAATVVFLILNKFNSKKFHGFFLLALYFVYLVTAILFEYNVV
jgi:sodium/potassium/calcium exchanger 6